jgi:hypothetical protein
MLSRDLVLILTDNAPAWLRSASRYGLGWNRKDPLLVADVKTEQSIHSCL